MKKVLFSFLLLIITGGLAGRRLFADSHRPVAGKMGGIQTGVFYLYQGLSYRTNTLAGTTNIQGEFHYRPGEMVTFSVGTFVLGSAPATKFMTSANIVITVDGNINRLGYPEETNLARLLQSLSESADIDSGINITPQTAAIVSKYEGKINFGESEAAFTANSNVVSLFQELHKTLRSGPQARNYVRWAMLGIHRAIDQKIPLRNGLYVLADIFRPIAKGKYPALVNLTPYGKAFGRTCICNSSDRLQRAAALDAYFQGNPDHRDAETNETPNPEDWVPKGYVIIRVDAPGLCNNPGVLSPYSSENANAYYDSIVWTTHQRWSDGKVGILGSSAFGINQLLVATLHPPGLKALVDIGGDADRFRTVVYTGGILNSAARFHWWSREVEPRRCLNQETFEDTIGPKQDFWLSHPFDNPAYYGTYCDAPPLEISADLSKITYPIIEVGPVQHLGSEHVRGSVETYMSVPSKDKMLRIVPRDFNSTYLYTDTGQKLFMAWFDHWLKGKDNGVLSQPKVQALVRTGYGGWMWQNATAYPLANTDYRRLYLDARSLRWNGDGKRKNFLKLSTTAPSAEVSKAYSADVNMAKEACWQPGISFVSQPLTEDMTLVGFIKLHVWVSSSSPDMDIFASLRVIGPDNKEIPYSITTRDGYYPVGKGWQRVSYRALDRQKSTDYRPWHLDTKAAYAPLKSESEVVPVDVEFDPTTAVIRKGDRIRLDIQPVDGCDWGTPHPMLAYREVYHRGATNTIYTGADYTSYVQLPVIPKSTGSEKQVMK